MAITVSSTTPTTGLLTSMGVGSGIDVGTLVDKLVAARKEPAQNRITAQSQAASTELSALGQVSAALSALQSSLASLSDGSAFKSRSVTTGDSTIFSATSTGTAVAGSYDIVVSQLADSLKASSGAYADSTTSVGTGTLTLAVGSASMSLSLDSTNNSLEKIRDAINGASDNPGVSATIVTGTDGAHLVFSSTKTGADNGFVISSSGGDGGLAALDYDASASTGNALTVIHAAADAQYTIDGLAGSSDSNMVSTAIDGVTLKLAKAGETTLSVANDTSKPTSALSNFVATYNSFVGIYQNLTKYDAASETAGALIGDATLNSINSTLSRIVSGTGNGVSLSSIGISLQVDGTLKLDSSALTTALSDGGTAVANMFTGTDGLGAQLNSPLGTWVGSSGLIASRTDSLNAELKDLVSQQSTLNDRMNTLTASYQAQFSALDTLMSKLNSTSSYLTQQFDALTNSNKK